MFGITQLLDGDNTRETDTEGCGGTDGTVTCHFSPAIGSHNYIRIQMSAPSDPHTMKLIFTSTLANEHVQI